MAVTERLPLGDVEHGWFGSTLWTFVEQTYVVTAVGSFSLGQPSHPYSLKPQW